MELYEAHLVLRASYFRSYNSQRYTDLFLNRVGTTNGQHSKPFHYQLCRNCNTVHEAFTPLPIQDGCISCQRTAWSVEGSQQYSIVHSNMMFWLAKTTLEDHALIELALSQLFELQQSKALEEVIL